MQSLFGRAVFTAGDAQYYWEDVLLAGVLRGDWSELEQLVREELACAQWSREARSAPPAAAVESAAAEFRYARNLVAAAEMHAWLERWGLGVGEWMDWVRRSLARQRAADRVAAIVAGHPVGAEEVAAALPVTLVCSGWAARLANQLAEQAAAHDTVGAELADDDAVDALLARLPGDLPARGFASLPGAHLRARARVVAALVVSADRFRERVVTQKKLGQEIVGRQLDWISVDFRTARFATESMAREAVLCVRSDGLALEEVAADAGTELRRDRRWLEEVDRELRDRLLAARAGELVGPLRHDGGFLIHQVDAKRLPSLDDPAVRRRAERSALGQALAAAVNDRVRWQAAL